MGLTDNQQRLIRSIAENDILSAKKCAVACLTEDTTRKNQWFCKKYKTIFETTGANMYELPQDLKGLLTVEDVSLSFKDGRYYLSDREQKVYKNTIRMKKVSKRLMEMGIPYINSTLLYGESGTGKTTFGRYIAFKTGLPFCYMNFSHLVDSHMGGTSKNISKAFTYAISNPCVFMLDEVDCISIRRSDTSSSSGTGGEMARVTITLMQEFDRLPNDVIVIGATNRIDRIDEALLRRFSSKHEVKVLNEAEKIAMVRKYLHDIGLDFPDHKISEMVTRNKNQSMLLNDLIRAISEKIAE
ncbi:ATP-binding protein [Extibacter muris]|uniref:AAA family ATPase n=1 Tax=Extibacter muris TaxID=1796622 RepID=A0A4R4FEX8_9FIRM|nr:ATP-binding protein [Extibacter muris]MCU0079316.1 ATP-binding protein [Extibacter muris]TDA21958.1 AAA family ATPase [Extibacter muris]